MMGFHCLVTTCAAEDGSCLYSIVSGTMHCVVGDLADLGLKATLKAAADQVTDFLLCSLSCHFPHDSTVNKDPACYIVAITHHLYWDVASCISIFAS